MQQKLNKCIAQVSKPLTQYFAALSLWVWCEKIYTSAFGDFQPFFSSNALKLCQVGWGPSLDRHFQLSPEMLWLGSSPCPCWVVHKLP